MIDGSVGSCDRILSGSLTANTKGKLGKKIGERVERGMRDGEGQGVLAAGGGKRLRVAQALYAAARTTHRASGRITHTKRLPKSATDHKVLVVF